MRRFFKLAVPLGMAGLAEESSFQVLCLLGGRLGPTETAANGVLAMIWAVAWGLWWGIGLGTQVRVGFHLGANNPRAVSLWIQCQLFMLA